MKPEISAGACIGFAVLLMLLPLPWVCAVLLAAVVHEAFHLCAVYLLGGSVKRFQISSRGAVLEMEPMSPIRELICTLAGPMGSFLLVLFARHFPRLAICGLIQGGYNLLPLMNLDGGRILRCILHLVLPPPMAGRVEKGVQGCIFALIAILCLCAAVRLGTFVLIPVFFLLPRILFRGTIGVLSRKRYGYDRITETNPAHCAEACTVHRR